MVKTPRLVLALLGALLISGCAVRSVHVAQLKDQPARFYNKSVTVKGVVTRSWGVPLVPFQFYSVDDGTGQITVIGHSGRFLSAYVETKVMPDDPFQVLDRDGVGQLVKMGTERGRSVKPGLKVGICGEHGGEPRSIAFCHLTGLDYVSCSPFRVPVARLAAAQAALEMQDGAVAADK